MGQIKQTSICIIGILEGTLRRQKGEQSLFKEMMPKTFQNVFKIPGAYHLPGEAC